MEAIWTRFLPSTRKVMEIMGKGELGKLCNVSADFGFKLEFDPQHRLFDTDKGGGALLDLGIYPVFISMLTAGKPRKIHATARFADTGVDNSCSMIFEQDNEVVSSLNYTLLTDSPVEANLLFENGWIRMESWWLTPGPNTLYRQVHPPERIEFPESGYGNQYEATEIMRCMDRD